MTHSSLINNTRTRIHIEIKCCIENSWQRTDTQTNEIICLVVSIQPINCSRIFNSGRDKILHLYKVSVYPQSREGSVPFLNSRPETRVFQFCTVRRD